MIFKRKSIRNFSDDEVSTDKIKNLIRMTNVCHCDLLYYSYAIGGIRYGK